MEKEGEERHLFLAVEKRRIIEPLHTPLPIVSQIYSRIPLQQSFTDAYYAPRRITSWVLIRNKQFFVITVF